MHQLFSPKSIAIIGASRSSKKVGGVVLKNNLESFKGVIYPVNPSAKKIMGLACYPTVSSIRQPVDVAVIAVPAAIVATVLEECGEAHIPYAVILSSGFSEAGQQGRERENKISQISKKYNLRVVGPNCLGIINPTSGFNTSFVSKSPNKGDIAFISQSGALCSAILDLSFHQGFGFSKFISCGNNADLCESDYLPYLADDPATKVILLYIEGLRDGRAFMKSAAYARSKKPVLVLKSGRTDGGARAASSHTGSLTGSDDVYTAAFAQTGVLQVSNTRELFDVGLALAKLPAPKLNSVAIVTNSGGPGVLCSDAAISHGLPLATLSPATIKALRSFLPPQANTHNPIDVIGDSDDVRYLRALSCALKDPYVGSILSVMCPQQMVDLASVARGISLACRTTKKPLVSCFMGGASMNTAREIFKKNGIPQFEDPEEGAAALAYVSRYYHNLKNKKLATTHTSSIPQKARQIVVKNLAEKKIHLDPYQGMELLSSYGIPTTHHLLVHSANDAKKQAQKIGFPVALKIVSPDIQHKTDVGGVVVGILTPEEVGKAYDSIIKRITHKKPKARIIGVSVEKMKYGREVIVGVVRDVQFGPVLTFGLGGVYVEVLKDVSRRVLPISRQDALTMISEIKSYPLLTGVRGEKSVDVSALADTLVKLGKIALDFEQILSIEINPLIASPQGVVAVDVLCQLNKTPISLS